MPVVRGHAERDSGAVARVADAHEIDPVTAAAAHGPAGQSRATSVRSALAEARDLLTQARGDGAFRASLPRALDLVSHHPDIEPLQSTAARLIMEDGDSVRALAAWSGVHQRFPAALEPFRMLIRLTTRTQGTSAAESIFRERFPNPDLVQNEDGLLALALGYEELGDPSRAEDVLRRATRLHPGSRMGWRHLIRLQEQRGGLLSAHHSATLALAGCGGDDIAQLHMRLARELQTLERVAPSAALDDSPSSVKVLEAILLELVSKRQSEPRGRRKHLGSTLMLTGSLGSGGAERQLVTTALSLNEAARTGRTISSYEIAGPIAVACRSLTAKRGNDFFLSTLDDAAIAVTEYGRLAPFGGHQRLSRAGAYTGALKLLPSTMREGAVQLVDFLRHEAPDVVHIWQDGMVFAAGLAAIMAGIPRIVLSVRTLPPTDRVNRWRVELEPLYRALLRAPGVAMTANSALAARRYEEWLDLPRGAVAVVPNGVARLDEAPAEGDEATWRRYVHRTADADFTLGAVMRLDQNKRPLEWLTVAEKFHRDHPGARFVVVGDGPLRQECQEFAQRLGMADRVLFTGLSGSVGFWLAKMDALMLLSEFEGMPNVLIEAQLAGKPVVTTPAGGAPETVLHDLTGWVLSSAETVDIDEAASCLWRLATMEQSRRHEIGAAARTWAERSFSVDVMLERTVRIFMAPSDTPMLR